MTMLPLPHAPESPATRPSRPRAGVAAGGLLALLLTACGDVGATDVGGAAAAPRLDERAVAREVRDLITAVTPLAAGVPHGEQSAWFGRRRDTLERLRLAGPEVGRAMLAAYRERPEAHSDIRSGLLDIAAHTVPEETRDILVDLVVTYGEDLALRRKACRLLGETSPETAIEVIEPLLMDPSHRGTYPHADQMLYAWIDAMDALGRDKSEGLANVVVDYRQPQEARHAAAEALGEAPSVRGRKALETVVVESSGNHYLRRKAIQALRDTVPKEEFCAYLKQISVNEADLQFQLFLASMIDDVCR